MILEASPSFLDLEMLYLYDICFAIFSLDLSNCSVFGYATNYSATTNLETIGSLSLSNKQILCLIWFLLPCIDCTRWDSEKTLKTELKFSCRINGTFCVREAIFTYLKTRTRSTKAAITLEGNIQEVCLCVLAYPPLPRVKFKNCHSHNPIWIYSSLHYIVKTLLFISFT